MNVLLQSSSEQIGGGNRSLIALANGLARNSWNPTVVCPASGPMTDACDAAQLACRVAAYHQPDAKSPYLSIVGYRQWQRIIEDVDPKIVHANDMSGARSISLAAWRSNRKLVCHVRFPQPSEFVAWAFRRLPKPDMFIFNSHALHQEMQESIASACPASKQVVLHNAVDLEQFVPSKKITKSSVRIGILANLLPVKGHFDFLDMAKILVDRGHNVRFQLIGEDIHSTGYDQKIAHRIQELGLSNSVEMLGHRNDIPNLLQQLDILVCSSLVEPFGRCLIEGMSCGLPVVATRVGGIPEVVDDERTGFLVPPKSPMQLADAVERLIADTGLRQRMGHEGRQKVIREFGITTQVERLLELYVSVLGNPNCFHADTNTVLESCVS